MLHREESADTSWPSLPTNQAHAENCHVTKTNVQAQAHSHYAVMLHREESDASWPSLPTNQAHAEKTAMNKNNRDCNVHELGDHLKCQRLRKSHVEGESNERIPESFKTAV